MIKVIWKRNLASNEELKESIFKTMKEFGKWHIGSNVRIIEVKKIKS